MPFRVNYACLAPVLAVVLIGTEAHKWTSTLGIEISTYNVEEVRLLMQIKLQLLRMEAAVLGIAPCQGKVDMKYTASFQVKRPDMDVLSSDCPLHILESFLCSSVAKHFFSSHNAMRLTTVA